MLYNNHDARKLTQTTLTSWVSIPLVNKSVQSRKNTKLRNLTIHQFEISAITENGTDRRSHDGPSCMFVMKIREVSEETCKYGKTKSTTARHDHDGWPRRPVLTTTARHDHDGPSWPRPVMTTTASYDYDGPSRGPRRPVARSTTARRDHDVPLRGPSTQPRFDRFPANRVTIYTYVQNDWIS